MVRCWSIPLLLLIVQLAALPALAANNNKDDEDIDLFEDEIGPTKPEPRMAIGPYILFGGSQQSGKTFSTDDSVLYQTTAATGQMIEPGVFFDYRYSPRWSVRGLLGYQIAKTRSQATQVGIPASPQTVDLDETLLTLGAIVKYQPVRGWGLWVGLGAQYQRGISLDLSMGGAPVPTYTADLPNLIQALVSVGYDFKVMGDWVVSPEIRVGDGFTASPDILTYQGVVSFGWMF